MLIRKLTCSTLAATSLCLGGMSTSVAQESASMAGLEESIVTARKKAETLTSHCSHRASPTSMPSRTSSELRSSAVSRRLT